MRKTRKASAEELAPYVWELPGELYGRWGDRANQNNSNLSIDPIDWVRLFGNNNPVSIEVGFGKGLFLVNSGQRHPENNYFGIEIIRKYQLLAATRIFQKRLPNVKVACADAKLLFREFIPPSSISTVHVYFPDPWWKKRHKKRLLMTSEFITSIQTALIPGGELHFVTDVQDYFQWVTETITSIRGLQRFPDESEISNSGEPEYLTHFERKFRLQGRPIYRTKYLRN